VTEETVALLSSTTLQVSLSLFLPILKSILGGKSNISLGWDNQSQTNQYSSGTKSYGTASNTQTYGQSYGTGQENQSFGGKYDQRNRDNNKPSPFATDDSPTKTSVKVKNKNYIESS